MAENFFKNDYVVYVEQSSLSEFIGRKIHANKFLERTQSDDLNIKYIGDGKAILYNNFNDFIEGRLL